MDPSPGGFRGPSEIILWKLDPPSRVRTFDWWGTVNSLSFSPDASLLAAGSSSGTVRVWRVGDGWLLMTVEGDATALAFSPDGSLLASGGNDGVIRLWKVPEGVELAALNGHAQGIVGLGFIPGGKGLFSASMDGTVRLWVVGPDAVD